MIAWNKNLKIKDKVLLKSIVEKDLIENLLQDSFPFDLEIVSERGSVVVLQRKGENTRNDEGSTETAHQKLDKQM